LGFAAHLRHVSPRLWFHFKFLRYRHLKGEREIRALRHIVPRGRMAIDVGSSIGLYSRALARLVPRVVAFEANPEVAAFAETVAPQNVEVVNVALSSTTGRALLRIPVNARGHTTEDLATIESKNQLAETKYLTVEVPTKRLDDYRYADCGFIKIDVEGHEEAVLDGAARLIETCRPTLMIELEDYHNPGTVERVTARLLRLSYAGYFMSRRKLLPIAEFHPHRHQNRDAVLALPPRRRRAADYINNFIFVPREALPPALLRGGD
jgi:FkbM family methyltransferase